MWNVLTLYIYSKSTFQFFHLLRYNSTFSERPIPPGCITERHRKHRKSFLPVVIRPWVYKENGIQCWRRDPVHSYESCSVVQEAKIAWLLSTKILLSRPIEHEQVAFFLTDTEVVAPSFGHYRNLLQRPAHFQEAWVRVVSTPPGSEPNASINFPTQFRFNHAHYILDVALLDCVMDV